MKSDESTTTGEKQKVVPFPGDLRDYFAAQALSVLRIGDGNFAKDYAARAYELADALLVARSR